LYNSHHDYEQEARSLAHDFWRICGALGISDEQLREMATKYYAERGEALP
jgi:G:T/U-mismatch repair DNA glycosylase